MRTLVENFVVSNEFLGFKRSHEQNELMRAFDILCRAFDVGIVDSTLENRWSNFESALRGCDSFEVDTNDFSEKEVSAINLLRALLNKK